MELYTSIAAAWNTKDSNNRKYDNHKYDNRKCDNHKLEKQNNAFFFFI